MLKLFDKIELDCKIVSIEDKENPFLDNNVESNNEFKELPNYISDTEYPVNTKQKTYKNRYQSKLGKRLRKNLSQSYNNLYDNPQDSGIIDLKDLYSDHFEEPVSNHTSQLYTREY